MQSVIQKQSSQPLSQNGTNQSSNSNSQNVYLSALINDLPELGKYLSSSLPNSVEKQQQLVNFNDENSRSDNEEDDPDSQTQYQTLSPRYQRLLLVTKRAIEEVLNRITIEKVLPCYPTLAKTPLGIYALTQATLQICKYFRDSCNYEFDQVYRERKIGKQLYSLEQLIREAQERKKIYENKTVAVQENNVESIDSTNENEKNISKEEEFEKLKPLSTTLPSPSEKSTPANPLSKTDKTLKLSTQDATTEQDNSSNSRSSHNTVSNSLSAAIRASDLTPSSIVAATVYPSQKKTLELLNAKLSELTAQNKERMAKFESVHNEIVDRMAHIDDGVLRLKARITNPILMTEQLIKKRQAKFFEDYQRLDKQKQLKSVVVKEERES